MNNIFDRYIHVRNFKAQISNIVTYLTVENIKVNVELKFLQSNGAKVTFFLVNKSGVEILNEIGDDIHYLKFIKLQKLTNTKTANYEYEDFTDVKHKLLLFFLGVSPKILDKMFPIQTVL